MVDVVNDVIINYKSVGLDKVGSEIKQTSVSLDGLVVSASSADKATASLENRFKSLERSLGTTSGQQQKFEKAQRDINTAVAQNPALQERANEALKAAEARYLSTGNATQQMGAKVGLARHELINLSRQAQDVVVSLQGGQGLSTVLLQQGSQIFDVIATSQGGLRGFASQAGEWAAKTFTATRLVAGGFAGLGAGVAFMAHEWSSAQKEIDRSLIGIGARTGTTVADVNKFASANATATGLSVDQARSSAIEFTKTGNIAVGQLKGLGDAVHGYSILTGKDATAATKDLAQALSGDLVKGAQQLNQTYGFLNPAMEDNIRNLVNQGQRAKAQQVIINAMAADNMKAEQTVGSLTKAWDGMWNAASRAKNAVGQAMTESPDEELERLERLQARRALPGRGNRIDELKGQKTADADSAFAGESARIQSAGRSAVEGVLPGIQQVQQLEKALGELRRAKEAANAVGLTLADNGAEQVIKNMITATQQATGETVRYHERVSQISQEWGNVGQSTALALQSMQNSLPVAQAWTESTRMRAQQQATYNSLIDQGKTSEEAAALAAKQYELSKAAAVANAQRLVQASEDNLDSIRAQGTGMEGLVAASQAYRDAIQGGATAMQANAIAANTLAASMERAAQASIQSQQSAVDAANGTTNGIVTAETFKRNPITGESIKPESTKLGAFGLGPGAGAMYKGGSRGGWDPFGSITHMMQIDALLKVVKVSSEQLANQKLTSGSGFDATIAALKTAGKYGGLTDSPVSQVGELYELMNARTSNKSEQVSNLQQQMDWLQTLPETIGRDQRIISLQQSIDALKNATDANTAATSATLNPLYSQGRGALSIGYYKAASGLDMVAQGPSSGDTVPFHAMVNGGERIQITPADKIGKSGSNDNSRTVVNNNNFVFNNTSTSNARRSQRQFAQGFGQMAAAGS